MLRVFKSAAAEADLFAIWDYIARDNLVAAEAVIRVFDEKMRLLAEQPALGRRREELAVDLRSFPVGNYLVFYRPSAHRLDIIRVLHSARDIDASYFEEL